MTSSWTPLSFPWVTLVNKFCKDQSVDWRSTESKNTKKVFLSWAGGGTSGLFLNSCFSCRARRVSADWMRYWDRAVPPHSQWEANQTERQIKLRGKLNREANETERQIKRRGKSNWEANQTERQIKRRGKSNGEENQTERQIKLRDKREAKNTERKKRGK